MPYWFRAGEGGKYVDSARFHAGTASAGRECAHRAGVICLLHFLLAHCGESREKTPGVLPTVGIFPQCRDLAEGSPTLADPRPRSEIILQFL